MRVLVLTSEWPTAEEPQRAMFVARQVDALRRHGVEVDVFPFRGSGKPLRYFRLAMQVRRLIRGGAYDLAHAQWGQSALLAFPRLLPVVVTFRGSDLEGIVGADGRYTRQGEVLRVASRWVARVADEVILVSASLARHINARPYTIIPSGLDLHRFRPMPRAEARNALGLPEQGFLVLFAASPRDPIKRIALAQEAVGLTRNRVRNADLVVASGVPFERIPLYMNACDALILTSMHEGSPNVVKEALACNLPVVSLDVGDVALRLDGLDGCFLCRDEAPAALAEALVNVARRGGRIDARHRVLDLSEDRMTGEVLTVYERAVRRWRADC
jgi:teichuronic acid biosynthesis glycosyltransferase TuaC